MVLLSVVSATLLHQAKMDPKSLGKQYHKDGDTMGEDWGQEYGPKQFQWRKEKASHGLDAFDKNLARDANSPMDKKHPLPGAPAGAPGAAAPAAPHPANMDPKTLGDAAHKEGDTMGEDWGQEYGPKQFQWRKAKAAHGMDDFDKDL